VKKDLEESSTYFLAKDTNAPVRIVTGTADDYTQIDYLDFQPGPIDISSFFPPEGYNCTRANLPGTSRLMTRPQLEDYFNIKPVFVGPVQDPIEVIRPSNSNNHTTATRIDPATVIAIGKQIWQVIVDNKPSSTVNTLSNGVVPAGANWGDFAGWRQYSWQPWGWSWKNVYGVEVLITNGLTIGTVKEISKESDNTFRTQGHSQSLSMLLGVTP